MRRHGFRLSLFSSIVVLCGALVCPRLFAAEDTKPDETGAIEQVVVTSTRLDDQVVPKNDVPASITLIDRAQIEASGMRNLQDLLAEETGVTLIDDTGNDVQKTLDLRGFANVNGVAVFLDGARVNDPRNNSVALEQIPLDAVERIEITRGPAAALAGGGAEAGVIRIITRRGTQPAGSLQVSGGSFGTRRYDGTVGDDFGRFDLFASGSYDSTDGFRTNAGGHQARFDGTGGWDLGDGRRLALSVTSSDLVYGNPGALTTAEFQADPFQNTFNLVDETDERARQGALNFQGKIGGGFSAAANLTYRTDHTKSLSTGRAAAAFGSGFYLDADGGTWSSTLQTTRTFASPQGSHLFAAGLEGLSGDTDSNGYSTSPTGDPTSLASQNTAGARNGALFVQDTWTISPRWIITGGARGDRSRVHYSATIPPPTPPDTGSDTRTFSRVSFRAGATYRPAVPVELYVSYGDAFLPPTPEQLFAFPGFGSNPDLLPEIAHAYELGTRAHGKHGTLEAAFFWTDTSNEIIFDPTPTATDPFGRNVNEGETRRRGIELSARGRLARATAFLNASYTEAEFANGVNVGNEVPLVPKVRGSAGIDAPLPRGFGLRADVLYVGEQVLDNDQANTEPKLDAYTVVNLRAAWSRALSSRADAHAGRFEIFAEARNLFDQRYATRGIFAFDFLTGVSEDFVTPAPGRQYFFGAAWKL